MRYISKFAASNSGGTIAQLVEQRTENPCVAGSNPAGTTLKPSVDISAEGFLFRVVRPINFVDIKRLITFCREWPPHQPNGY